MIDFKLRFEHIKIFSFLFFLIPFALITGPFLSDLIVSLLAIYYLYLSYKYKKLLFFENIFVKIFIVFYIICIFSSFYSENYLFSLSSSFFYIRFLFFSLAVVFLVKNNNNFYLYFFYSLITVFLILTVDSYFQFFFKENLIGYKLLETKDSNLQVSTIRISSFFGDEYILGSFLSRLSFVLIGLYLHLRFQKKKLNNILFLLFCIFFVLIIFLTGERLSFVIQFFCLIYIFILIPKIRKKLFILSTVFLILLSLVLYFNNDIKNRMINSAFFFIYNSKTLNGYISPEKFIIYTPDHHELYVASFKMFLDKPFFGHGYKTFRFVCKKIEYYRSVSSCSTHPHNILLQVSVELGLIGLLFLFLVYYYLIKKFIFFLKLKNLTQSPLKIFLLSIISANLFPLFPSGNFFNNWISIIYYLPISLYLSIVVKKNTQ